MSNYYIKDLESITGVKAHTIRIWEQRYNLISPKRTETNIRYYDDEDVKLLMNIAQLNKNGLKISKIASLSLDEIQAEAFQSCQKCNEFEDVVNTLLLATYNLNEDEFNKTFNRFIVDNGFENALLKVAMPLLQRLGDLWVSGSIHPALEHFASNIIRFKMQIGIEKLRKKKRDAKKFLLLLAPGENHDISLLLANFIIRSAGHEVLYLGQNTPIHQIDSVLETYQSDYIVSIFSHCKSEVDPAKFVNDLHAVDPNITFLLSGCSILGNLEKITEKFILKDKVLVLKHPDDLTAYLKGL